eukprot:726271_1
MSVLAEVLPNTQKTCESLVSQWIDTQKSRSHEWLDRCLQADSWSPVDDKCMFSSSIVDIFSVLDSLLNGYSAMLQRFLPDGANTLGAFCDLINAIITVYANSLVQLSGQVEDIAPIYELLLKPIKKQLSLKRFKTFTGTEISSTSSTTSLKPPSEHNLASQSIEVLCVRLNCLHFAHEKIAALAKRAGETCKKLGGGWEADPWGLGGVYKFEGKVETPTVKCSIDFDPAMFSPAIAAVSRNSLVLIRLMGARVAFGDLRTPLMDGLYLPSVAQSRIKGGEVINRLDEVMGPLYRQVAEEMFANVVE